MVKRCNDCGGLGRVAVAGELSSAAVREWCTCGACAGLGRAPSRIELALARAWKAGVRTWHGMLLAAFPPAQFPRAHNVSTHGGPAAGTRPLAKACNRLGIARDQFGACYLNHASIVSAILAAAPLAQPVGERQMAAKKTKAPREFTITLSVREKPGTKLGTKKLSSKSEWQAAVNSTSLEDCEIVQVQAMLVEPAKTEAND